STLRSRDCSVRVSASTGVKRNVAAAFWPVGRTMADLMTHRSPSFDQEPSPKAPDSSNAQERMRLVRGSQPIHCTALPTERVLTVVENDPIRKFWFGAQPSEIRSPSPASVVPAQSPTAHSRTRRCSELLGGVKAVSRTLFRSHWPSFLTWTLVKRTRLGGLP